MTNVEGAARSVYTEEGDMNYQLFKKRFDFLIVGIVKKDEYEDAREDQRDWERSESLKLGKSKRIGKLK